jgi:hypothetical protein
MLPPTGAGYRIADHIVHPAGPHACGRQAGDAR